MIDGRPLLFYSAWALGYHNPEAERKALALAADGWDVVYVAGIGIRNPGRENLRKAGRLLTAGVRGRAPAQRPAREAARRLRTASLLVAPPRQLAPLRRLNARWVERRLRAAIDDWPRALVWVRRPTPELNAALRRLRPAGVVYECVDAYHLSPGIVGRWRALHDAAERELVGLAAAVVTPSEVLARHLRGQGAERVEVVPHGVELWDWRPPRPREERLRSAVIGFAGTLDRRLDGAVLRAVARAHPEWRIRLVGPVQEEFEQDAVADLANVTVEPPVPYERLGELLASFDAGIMPYHDDEFFRHMTPVKNLELMAAGRPAVARRSPALEPYAGVLAFATTPGEFVAALERALAEDSPELAARRRAVAEGASWERRFDELRRIARAAAGEGA